jgi:hypothetical protein
VGSLWVGPLSVGRGMLKGMNTEDLVRLRKGAARARK